MGNLVTHKWELPRHRATDSFWNKCLVVSLGSRPRREACRRPRDLIVVRASLPQKPRVSTANGIKEIPEDRQRDE